MKVWLDDLRPEPKGWTRCYTAEAVLVYLKTGAVEDLSLDHDLGEDLATGYDLCKWMAEYDLWPKNRPTIHSQNPVGRQNMQATIDRYGPYPS